MHIQIIKGARALMERGWCQLHEATDSNGLMISYLSPKAAEFCLSGALRRANVDLGNNRAQKLTRQDSMRRWRKAQDLDFIDLGRAIEALEAKLSAGWRDLSDYNDAVDTTQEDVLALCDRGC